MLVEAGTDCERWGPVLLEGAVTLLRCLNEKLTALDVQPEARDILNLVPCPDSQPPDELEEKGEFTAGDQLAYALAKLELTLTIVLAVSWPTAAFCRLYQPMR